MEKKIKTKKIAEKKEAVEVRKIAETISEGVDPIKEVTIDEALKELRKEEKRKFVQTVDLIVNLQKFDSRKESLNSFIQVPNSYERDIAAFLTTKVKGVEVILKDSFDNYKNLRDAKRLAKKYDMFISAAPLMGLVATKFGRALGPSGKMPSPQLGIIVKEDEETIRKLIEKMKKSVKVRTKEKTIKIGVGKEDMTDAQLKENLEAAIAGIIDLLPQKRDNLKNVLVKFTMTKPFRIKL